MAAEAGAPALVQARADAGGSSFDEAGRAELAWRAPGECVEVYRVRVDEQFRDPSVALFVGRQPEHSSWALAVRARSGVHARGLAAVDSLLIALDDPAEPERRRQLWWSAKQVGPSAPDFACRHRRWDPVEDALALGWPLLPGHALQVGARWQGQAVEGRCHETTCVDDQGQFPHDRPCRARPWQEQLAGVADGVALILGDWDDGWEDRHDPAGPEIGILTSRELLIAEGRPLHAQVRIEQRWSGVVRNLELTRIDDCGDQRLATSDNQGSGDGLDGLDGLDDRSVVAEIRARLRLPPAEPVRSAHTPSVH